MALESPWGLGLGPGQAPGQGLGQGAGPGQGRGSKAFFAADSKDDYTAGGSSEVSIRYDTPMQSARDVGITAFGNGGGNGGGGATHNHAEKKDQGQGLGPGQGHAQGQGLGPGQSHAQGQGLGMSGGHDSSMGYHSFGTIPSFGSSVMGGSGNLITTHIYDSPFCFIPSLLTHPLTLHRLTD